jgi:hypothetical protein
VLQTGTKKAIAIPDEDLDFDLERRCPAFGNFVPRDIASCGVKERRDAGFGGNDPDLHVFSDSK